MNIEFLLDWLEKNEVKGQRRWWLTTERKSILSAIENFTSFAPVETQIPARISLIKAGILSAPLCGVCGNETKVRGSSFAEFCSQKCMVSSPLVKERRQESIKERFGEVGLSDPTITNKTKQTLIEKHGSLREATDSRLNKAKQTNVERYGEEYIFQTKHFKEKNSKTLMDRYGGHHLRNPHILEKQEITNRTRYGSSHPLQNKEIKSNQEETNRLRYGNSNAMQNHLISKKSFDASVKRYGVHHSRRHLSSDASDCFHDADQFSEIIREIGIDGFVEKTNYCRDYVIARAGDLGLIEISPSASLGEKSVADFIRELGFECLSTRKLIAPYEIDIWIPELKIGIEYCGHYWHSEAKKDSSYHLMKLDLMKPHGRLIHILEGEWVYRNRQVKDRLRSLLGVNKKIYARKTTDIPLDRATAVSFMTEHHIQGSPPIFTTAVGLMLDTKLVACMAFTKRKDVWELVRYCSVDNVVGGISKLVSVFRKSHIGSVVSFHDLRWGYSESYERAGLIKEKQSPPDYIYVKNNKFEHKFNHRKKFYSDRYDSSMTERQIMKEEGWLRLYDCGKIKYRLD